MIILNLKEIDCQVGMAGLPPESIDVVVTSPPYNLGIKYRKYNDKQKHDFYLEWTKAWLQGVKRVLAPDGSLFLNLGGCPRKPLLPHEILLTATHGLVLQNTFHWIKSISIETTNGFFSPGHFKPINSSRYVNDCHEHIFHLTKTGNVQLDRLALGVPFVDKSNIKRWKQNSGRDRRCRGNCWFIPYKTIQSRSKQRPHPATFPPELAAYAISLHGGVNTKSLKVLDPFVGIGNAAVGAMMCDVAIFQGFDIDGSYLEDAQIKIDKYKEAWANLNRVAESCSIKV